MIDDEERGLASRKLRSGLIVASFAPVPVLAGLALWSPDVPDRVVGAPPLIWAISLHLLFFVVLAWRSGDARTDAD